MPFPPVKEQMDAILDGVEEVITEEDLEKKVQNSFNSDTPLVVKQGCLKCHAEQGYRVGDIRGGISASIPLERIHESQGSYLSALIVGYGTLFVVGLFFFGHPKVLMRRRSPRCRADRSTRSHLRSE